jgi:hypothetical protein
MEKCTARKFPQWVVFVARDIIEAPMNILWENYCDKHLYRKLIAEKLLVKINVNCLSSQMKI